MLTRASAWKRQSDHDFDHAIGSMDRGEWDWACYAAMQSAEKTLKAGLLAADQDDIWGHNLLALLDRLAQAVGVEAASSLRNAARLLSQFNALARYPVGDMEAAPVDLLVESQARDALSAARALRAWVDENVRLG